MGNLQSTIKKNVNEAYIYKTVGVTQMGSD